MNRTLRMLIMMALAGVLILGGGLLLLARGMGLHRYDPAEVPAITIGPGLRPPIAFTPETAYQLQVYEGAEDGDGLGVLWTVRGPGSYENTLRSPILYGEPPEGTDYAPAPPLEPGKVYTVTVTRKDPQGTGDSFLSTHHRYHAKATFTAREE